MEIEDSRLLDDYEENGIPIRQILREHRDLMVSEPEVDVLVFRLDSFAINYKQEKYIMKTIPYIWER